MRGRLRVGAFLLLALAGCPQLQNDDWVVVDDGGSPTDAGDTAIAPDAGVGGDANTGDASARDSSTDASSSGDAAQDAETDGTASGPDGQAAESGIPDSTASDGTAVKQTLYCGLTNPRGITLWNDNVCWVGDVNPRGLFCAPAAGGGAVVHVDGPGDESFLGNAFDLLFDTTNVYWTNGGNNEVMTRPQSGGQPQLYFSGGGRVSFLAPGDGTTLWATDFPDPSDPGAAASGEVVVGPMPGGTSSNAIYTGQGKASGVAVYNGNVYWGAPDGLAFGSVIGNGTIFHVDTRGTPVAGVAIDSNGVAYFLAGQSLYRYVTGASTGAPVYTETGPLGVGDVALDDQYVYFSEPDAGCIVRIAR